MNSGIVDESNWNNYFGPFAYKTYNYAIIGTLKLIIIYDLSEVTAGPQTIQIQLIFEFV